MAHRVHPSPLPTINNDVTTYRKDNPLNAWVTSRFLACLPWSKLVTLGGGTRGPAIIVRRRSLGRGGHANIMFGRFADNHVPVAVKVLDAADPHSRREVEAFKRLSRSHPNIVAVYAAQAQQMGACTYLPMELCDGSLLEVAEKKCGLEEADIAPILLDVLSGLAFMYSRGVYHTDVKPDNILMKDGVAKLSDLGASVFRDDEPTFLNGCAHACRPLCIGARFRNDVSSILF